jgi:hypothetical protein
VNDNRFHDLSPADCTARQRFTSVAPHLEGGFVGEKL